MHTMTIEEMRQHEWTISWSGGKDSTATVILCHEYGIPIKEIIYVRMMYDDTLPATLPIMTEFVDRTINTFESWGYQVRVVPSIKTAKQMINRVYRRSKKEERNGKYYGVTAFMRGMCTFTSVKQQTIDKLALDEYQMIGYASDEEARLHRLTDSKQSIMATLGITEIAAFEICKKYNLLSPLYEMGMPRDGCWFCPNAGAKERKILRESRPDLIEKIDAMISMCDYDIVGTKTRNNWVRDHFRRLEYGEQMHIFDFIE